MRFRKPLTSTNNRRHLPSSLRCILLSRYLAAILMPLIITWWIILTRAFKARHIGVVVENVIITQIEMPVQVEITVTNEEMTNNKGDADRDVTRLGLSEWKKGGEVNNMIEMPSLVKIKEIKKSVKKDDNTKLQSVETLRHQISESIQGRSMDNQAKYIPDISQRDTPDDATPPSTMKHPSVIIVGTQKGGTSALSHYLSSHPQMIRSVVNETWFFMKDDQPHTLENYHSYFNMTTIQSNPQLHSFEKSPMYMLIPHIAHSIVTLAPWAKIVMMLRNPVERAYSHFKMIAWLRVNNRFGLRIRFRKCVAVDIQLLKKMGVVKELNRFLRRYEGGDLGEALMEAKESNAALFQAWEKYVYNVVMQRNRYYKGCVNAIVGRGLYVLQLAYYLDAIKKEISPSSITDHLLIMNSDDLRPDDKGHIHLKTLTDFIGIHEVQLHKNEVIFGTDTVDWISSQEVKNTKDLLEDFYRPYNEILYSLLGQEWKHRWVYH